MKNILSVLFVSITLAASGQSSIPLMVSTNGDLLAPTNFWKSAVANFNIASADSVGAVVSQNSALFRTFCGVLPATLSWQSDQNDYTARIAFSGPFNQWGMPLGPSMPPFNRIDFTLNWWGATPPTVLRVVARDVNEDGNILGDVTFSPQWDGSPQYLPVSVVFSNTISSTNSIYLQLMGDQPFSYMTCPIPIASGNAFYGTSGMTGYPSAATTAGYSLKCSTFHSPGAYPPQGIPNYGDWAVTSASSITGWQAPMGVKGRFNYIKLALLWGQKQYPQPQMLHVVVRDQNSAGTVLADQTVNLSLALNVVSIIKVDLAAAVNSTNLLWLEFKCDHPVQARRLLPSALDDSYGRALFTIMPGDVLDPAAWVLASSQYNFWCEVGYEDPACLQYGSAVGADNALSAYASKLFTQIGQCLPATIYALEGREANVYFNNILRTPIGLSNYKLVVTCAKGKQEDARWVYTPAIGDAGTYPWQLDIWFGGKSILTVTSTLVVKAMTAGSGVTRKVLLIGDSTLGGSGTAVGSELLNLFSNTNAPMPGGADPMALSVVGSLTGTNVDSNTNSRIIKHDAISGWTIGQFFTGTNSPMYFDGSFNFATFLVSNNISMATNDWVLVHLGINDVFGCRDDASLFAVMATMTGQLDSMISNIQTAAPGVRIGLLVTIPPDETQDGFGASYGNSCQQWRYKRNRYLWAENMVKLFQAGYTKVYVFPYHAGIDCVNGFPSVSTTAAARFPLTMVSKHSNGVHPTSAGYYQLADEIKAFLKGHE